MDTDPQETYAGNAFYFFVEVEHNVFRYFKVCNELPDSPNTLLSALATFLDEKKSYLELILKKSNQKSLCVIVQDPIGDRYWCYLEHGPDGSMVPYIVALKVVPAK